MTSKENLIKEWEEFFKNPKNIAMQGGEDKDAFLKRIQESNLTSDEIIDILLNVMKTCMKKRMELEVELSYFKAKYPKDDRSLI